MEDKEHVLKDVPMQMKKNLEVLETANRNIVVEDGKIFIMNLRKEARRQKAMKACEDFELQTRKIEDIPAQPSEAIERRLADEFEIIEEE
jgi:hypothetical protein